MVTNLNYNNKQTAAELWKNATVRLKLDCRAQLEILCQSLSDRPTDIREVTQD